MCVFARVHPHNLVGKDCENGLCIVEINTNTLVKFTNLGIQCIKRNDVEKKLKIKSKSGIDPFLGKNFRIKQSNFNY